MTKPQFVRLMTASLAPLDKGPLFEFVQKFAESLYDPALEHDAVQQIELAIKPFAMSAEVLDDLVAALADTVSEMKQGSLSNG